MAKVDFFLKIDGIEGESMDAKHAKEIELQSWSWGAMNSGTFSSTSGGGGGKVSHQDFTFSQVIQKSTPKLVDACNTGKHIPNAVLTCRKAGGGTNPGQEYLKIKFSDILVSHYQTGGHPGDVVPTDSISLNYAQIEFSYAPQKQDGTLDGALISKFNLKTNTSS
jgi:type VI secretion system secreted protein Hcp